VTSDLARIGSLPALPAAARARGDGLAAAAAHAEKVTLSAEGREGRQSNREIGPVPRGTVRWYRAACLPRPPRPAPPADPAPGHATHSGVAAYRRAMARAAA
jgi:hypothetical protein